MPFIGVSWSVFTVGKVHYNEHYGYDPLQKPSVPVLLGLSCVATAAAELVAYPFYLVKTLQQSRQLEAAAEAAVVASSSTSSSTASSTAGRGGANTVAATAAVPPRNMGATAAVPKRINTGALHIARGVVQRAGVRGLYSGVGIAWAKSAPAACITYLTFETVKAAL